MMITTSHAVRKTVAGRWATLQGKDIVSVFNNIRKQGMVDYPSSEYDLPQLQTFWRGPKRVRGRLDEVTPKGSLVSPVNWP